MAQPGDGSVVNVALAGGTGDLGAAVVDTLQKSSKFIVTVLARSLHDDVPAGVRTVVVDYGDVDSLKRALVGQHTVVSTLPRTAILSQLALIDAAIATGVERFIPSEFGGNLQNKKTRQLLNYQAKLQVEKYLEEKAAQNEITYTYIYTGAFMDWSIRARILVDFHNASISLYDGGDHPVSMSTLPSAAQTVLEVLSNYHATKNRAVYTHARVMSQRQLLSYAREVTPGLQWTVKMVDLEQLERDAAQQNKAELANMTRFHAGALKAGFAEGYGNRYSEVDNALLGVQAISDSGIKALLRSLYEESRKS